MFKNRVRVCSYTYLYSAAISLHYSHILGRQKAHNTFPMVRGLMTNSSDKLMLLALLHPIANNCH